jgi:hypothetical protein
MKKFYSPKSAAERGTLYHIRNIFGHRGVTTKVMDCVNHVVDLLQFVTEGLVCTQVMENLKWSSLSDLLPDSVVRDMETLGIQATFDKLATYVVDQIWPSIDTVSIDQVMLSEPDDDPESGEFCICKEGRSDSFLLEW